MVTSWALPNGVTKVCCCSMRGGALHSKALHQQGFQRERLLTCLVSPCCFCEQILKVPIPASTALTVVGREARVLRCVSVRACRQDTRGQSHGCPTQQAPCSQQPSRPQTCMISASSSHLTHAHSPATLHTHTPQTPQPPQAPCHPGQAPKHKKHVHRVLWGWAASSCGAAGPGASRD